MKSMMNKPAAVLATSALLLLGGGQVPAQASTAGTASYQSPSDEKPVLRGGCGWRHCGPRWWGPRWGGWWGGGHDHDHDDDHGRHHRVGPRGPQGPRGPEGRPGRPAIHKPDRHDHDTDTDDRGPDTHQEDDDWGEWGENFDGF
ncbi:MULTISPECIES: hypothetical protein [unclassified Nonomuraea]|uniref:hypothetical protein n=1 Tax=unclassified Nonomuraea TaxID=2593643 RepID=UPI003402A38A